MVAAIYYHPDGFETSREKLMGRHAAGEGFLKALCQHATSDHLYAYCFDNKHFEHFLGKVKSFSSGQKTCTMIHPTSFQKLAEPGCIFMSGPVLADLAWLRRHGNQRDFSLCGVTHTTATDRAMDAIGNLISAPLQPWDALVCTSQSVRSMVQKLMHNYQDYLRDRFGAPASTTLPIELPVIPLGVDCSALHVPQSKRDEYRKTWREKLKIKSNDLVVLYVGRFSFHDKAHPIPMFMAMEQAARSQKKQLTFVMAGWFQSEEIQKEFIAASKIFCPSVKVAMVDGRNATVKKTIWHMADCFLSLSDNVQETFGLTPIEAMAAGLPCVISDWDGYKETVRNGIDGYRVPTWTVPPGFGLGIALTYAAGVEPYGKYVGYQSQFTSVDVPHCATALGRILGDEALRKEMGEAGKKRAREIFDWKVVIRQYEELWSHQAEVRKQAVELGSRENSMPINPLRDDPFSLFSVYPTHAISPETIVLKSPAAKKEVIELIRRSKMTTLGSQLTYPEARIIELANSIPTGQPTSVQDLCSKVPASEGRALIFSLLWLSKTGLLRLTPKARIEDPSLEGTAISN